jgi:hypothetical protein
MMEAVRWAIIAVVAIVLWFLIVWFALIVVAIVA